MQPYGCIGPEILSQELLLYYKGNILNLNKQILIINLWRQKRALKKKG